MEQDRSKWVAVEMPAAQWALLVSVVLPEYTATAERRGISPRLTWEHLANLKAKLHEGLIDAGQEVLIPRARS